MFKVLNKDNKENFIFIQGARSKNSFNDIAGIVFQNYDDDSKVVYNMAALSMSDAFGDSNSDGIGNLIFKTNTNGSNLVENMRLDYQGNLCIGTSNSVSKLTLKGNAWMDGDVTMTNNLSVSNITAYSLHTSNIVITQPIQTSNITVTNAFITNINNDALSASNATIATSLNTPLAFATTLNTQTLSASNATIATINFTGSLLRNNVPFQASRWSTSNVNSIFVLSNVGIGLSNPLHSLDVVGNINLTGTLLQNNAPFQTSRWSSNATGVFTVSNVGVGGLPNSSNALTVSGNANVAGILTVQSNLLMPGALTFRGLEIRPSNGQAANITQSTVRGLSNLGTNGATGMMLSVADSNSFFRFNVASNNTEIARLTGTGTLSLQTLAVSSVKVGTAPYTTSGQDAFHLFVPTRDGYGSNNFAITGGWGGYHDMCGITWNAGNVNNNEYYRYNNRRLGWSLLNSSGGESLVFNCYGAGYSGTNIVQGVSTVPLRITPSNVTIGGQITSTFCVHLHLCGTATNYTNENTLQTGVGYTYPKFPNSNVNTNWAPTYTNTTRLAIPYAGLYYLKLTLSVGTGYESFITRNEQTGINDLNLTNGNLLCTAGSTTTTGSTTISATVFCNTADYINFGFYNHGTGAPGSRSSFTATLLQRTS